MKLNYLKLLSLICIILILAFIFFPFKQEVVCQNYQCHIKNYYLLKYETNTVDISNGLSIIYHPKLRSGSYWELNPLNIVYYSADNANKDMRNIIHGSGKITKYSLGIVIITFILSLIMSLSIV